MKKMTCRQMGGTCDEVFEGENPREVIEKERRHIESYTDLEHVRIMERMQNMDKEEQRKWDQEFYKIWDSATEENSVAPP